MKHKITEYVDLYEKLGFVCVPVAPNGKNPIMKGWSKIESNDETRSCFKENSNLGIVMGKASDVIVIDVDIKLDKGIDGTITLANLEEKLGALPQTVMSETPHGGIHYYFKYVEGIRNRKNVGEGIDIQGDGTQSLEYPSTVDGGEYNWIIDPIRNEIATLPVEWQNFLCEKTKDENDITLSSASFDAPSEIKEGNRNNTIASYVGSLIGKNTKTDLLLKKTLKYNKEACNPPLDDGEVETIVKSMIQTDRTNKENKVIENVNNSSKSDSKIKKAPKWFYLNDNGEPRINEKKFAEWYVEENELYCINGRFFTRYGFIKDDEFKCNIQNIIGDIVTTGLAKKTNDLLNVVKNEAYTKLDSLDKYKIQFDNASFDVRKGKLEPCEPFLTLHQIPHDYDPNAKCPQWIEFMNGLFYEDDLKVVQEYLGYCLIPNTLAQTALFIIGDGGEGKSRITIMMEHVLGTDNIVIGKFNDLQDRFSMSSLDHQTLFIDDDLSLTSLDDTSNFKKIVTSETSLEVEAKGKPKYKTKLYSRILCLGNGAVQSKFDKTDGFYRRLLLCKVKPKEPDRLDDRMLSDRLDEEIPGVINWLLEGLLRVVNNKFNIKPSLHMQKELQIVKDNSDTITLFMNDEQYIEYTKDIDDKVSIKDLYNAYERWCDENSYLCIKKSTFNKTIRRIYKNTLSKSCSDTKLINEITEIERVYLNKKQVRGLAGVKIKNFDHSFTINT